MKSTAVHKSSVLFLFHQSCFERVQHFHNYHCQVQGPITDSLQVHYVLPIRRMRFCKDFNVVLEMSDCLQGTGCGSQKNVNAFPIILDFFQRNLDQPEFFRRKENVGQKQCQLLYANKDSKANWQNYFKQWRIILNSIFFIAQISRKWAVAQCVIHGQNGFARNNNAKKGLLDSGQSFCVNIILKQYQLPGNMEKQAQRRAELVDLEASEISQSTQYRHLDNKEIDQLYASYNLMKQFSDQIVPEKTSNLTQILEIYAERPIKFELLSKNVMHILDKRIQRMLKNKKLKKNWSSQDAEILCWTFCYYCKRQGIKSVEQTTLEDWVEISKLIPGSNPDSCMFKILSLKKVKLAKQKWTQEQNGLLLQITMNSFKKNWKHISQELYKRNENPSKIFRNAKQCKEHWVCYLNPDLKKGSWSLEEDRLLMRHVFQSNGSRKWAEIARIFGGRTENALKNRYTLIIERLRRQKNVLGSEDDLPLIKEYLEKMSGNDDDQNQEKLMRQKQTINKSNEEKQVPLKQIYKYKEGIEKPQQKLKQQPMPDMRQKMMYSIYTFPSPVNMAPTYLNYSCQNMGALPVQYMQQSTSPMFFLYPTFGGLSQN